MKHSSKFSIMNLSGQTQHWLDTALYPFENKFISLEEGQMHYVDEGEGDIILFVHGTPTWSFLYRDYIAILSKKYRCIAIDHIGFGLSEKPDKFDGKPQTHSKNLSEFIEKLNLKDITLVVHDFGGPIGLSYAIENPNNISKIVLFNTWLWSTKEDKDAQKIDKILHSKIGNFIYLNTNFSPRVLLKKAFYNKKALSKKIHKHYRNPFPNKNSRYGLLNIGKSLIGSSDWYQNQWEQMSKIKDKPFLILWGEKDDFIKKTNLEKWTNKLTNKKTYIFESGHFVQEEKFNETLEKMEYWLEKGG